MANFVDPKAAGALACGEVIIVDDKHLRIKGRRFSIIIEGKMKRALLKEVRDGYYVNIWYIHDDAFDTDLIVGFNSSSKLVMRIASRKLVSWSVITASVLSILLLIVYDIVILTHVLNTATNVLLVLLPSMLMVGILMVVIGHQKSLINADKAIKKKLPHAKKVMV